jgi:hypothetical protein
MAEIPECFNQPGAAFVLLPTGIKFPPSYKEWQKPEKARTFAQAHAHDGNVGILAGGGYIGLDKDNPAAFGGLELPITTMWETRPGRYGMRFKVSDNVAAALAGIGKKADLAQLYLYRDGKQCGEVKLQKSYQVVPPSWKKLEDGQRADYKLLDPSPPATITLAKLLADLQAIGITFRSKLEANAAKLEDIGKKAHHTRIESDETRTRRYAEAALRDEVLTLAGTPEGNRNVQLNDSAFNLGQFVAVGLLSEDEVIAELTKAAENTGLDSDAIRKTITSGLEAGKQHPRRIPETPNDIGPKDEPVSDDIEAEAEKILDDGTLPEYWLKTYHKLHEGDSHIGTSLLITNLTANIINCHGIAVVEVNGDSGDGKSHAVSSVAELLGEKWCDISGLSPKALIHHAGTTIHEGMMVILDDNRPDDAQADIIKRNQTSFKSGYVYKTVGNGLTPISRHVPPGVQIVSTEVDARSEDEVQNRTLMLEAEGNLEKDIKIIDNDLTALEKGIQPLDDPSIKVCNRCIDKLKGCKYTVVIPNASKTIKWNERSKSGRANVRNYNMFIDFILAFAVMRYRKREHSLREDDTVSVVATREDFASALALYMLIHKQMATKLTSKEGELIQSIKDAGGRLLREDAMKCMKVTDGRISQLIHGQRGQGGLKAKYPGFYTESVNEEVSYNERKTRNYLVLTDVGTSQSTLNGVVVEWDAKL